MNSLLQWSSLFNHSSFFCLEKDQELALPLAEMQSRLIVQNITNYHPNRQKEFLLGRVCASKAHELYFGSELLELPMDLDRSPVWPSGVVGSISHNQFWIGAAVAQSQNLLGIGIDLEIMGRVKLELSRYIRSAEDLKTHEVLNANEILTIIFSAKESLYKALYPTVKSFFGFETAALKEIDLVNGTFKIELISKISSHIGPALGPSGRFKFEGRFKIIGKNCLTVIEILK